MRYVLRPLFSVLCLLASLAVLAQESRPLPVDRATGKVLVSVEFSNNVAITGAGSFSVTVPMTATAPFVVTGPMTATGGFATAGPLTVGEALALGAAAELTIAGGELTPTVPVIAAQPETLTSDDLTTVHASYVGQVLWLVVAEPATDVIVVRHGVGNLSLPAGQDITLTHGALQLTSLADGSWVAVGGGGSTGGGGAAAWGAITGTLGDQTDLAEALALLVPLTSLAQVATSGAYTDLVGAPTLATVATSGSFLDLLDLPASYTPTGGGGGAAIDDAAGLGDTDVVWSADWAARHALSDDLASLAEADDGRLVEVSVARSYLLPVPETASATYLQYESSLTDTTGRHTVASGSATRSTVWAIGAGSLTGSSLVYEGNGDDWYFPAGTSFAVAFVFRGTTGSYGVEYQDEGWMYPWNLTAQPEYGTITYGMMGSYYVDSLTFDATGPNRVELSRSGTTLRLFLNGALVDTQTDNTDWGLPVGYDYGFEMWNTAPTLTVSAGGGSGTTFIDEVFTGKGEAWHTSAYTPYSVSQVMTLSSFVVDDEATSDLALWSAQQIRAALAEKADTGFILDSSNSPAKVKSAAWSLAHAVDRAKATLTSGDAGRLLAVAYTADSAEYPWTDAENGLFLQFENDYADSWGHHSLSFSVEGPTSLSFQPGHQGQYALRVQANTNETRPYYGAATLTNSDLEFGAGEDFTIEIYLRPNQGSYDGTTNGYPIRFGYGVPGGSPPDPGFKWAVRMTSSLTFVFNGTDYAFGDLARSLDTWQHICIERQGGVIRAAKDGVVSATTHSVADAVAVPATKLLTFWTTPSAGGYYEYDGLRIVKGRAIRHLADGNFTPGSDLAEYLPISLKVNDAGTSTGDLWTASRIDSAITATVALAVAPYALSAGLAPVATTGDYADLTGTPSLATVATSGAYADLTGTPEAPWILAEPWTTDSWTSDTGLLSQSALADTLRGVAVRLADNAATLTTGDVGRLVAVGEEQYDDADTALLLHLDNNLTDSSRHGRTVTGVSHAFSATAQFGSHAFAGNGSDDRYLSIPTSADWSLARDFTLDFWYRWSGTWSRYLVSRGDDAAGNDWYLYHHAAGSELQFTVRSGYSPVVYLNGGSIAGSTWYHVAVVRSGATWTLYVDGIAVDSQSYSGSLPDLGSALLIGTHLDSDIVPDNDYYESIDGNLDEFRWSTVARWTAAFTPPGGPYWHADYRLSQRSTRELPYYAADTGSADTLAVALTPTLTAYYEGLQLLVKLAADNTGAATCNVDSLGAKAIQTMAGAALASGDLKAGGIAHLVYDGTQFRMIGK